MSSKSESTQPTNRFVLGWRIGRRYLRRYRRAYIFGALLLLLTNLFQITIPWLLKIGIDAIRNLEENTAVLETVGWVAVGIAVAAVCQAVVRVGSRWVLFRAGRDVEYEIRDAAYEKLLLLDPVFYRSRSRGDLISRVSNDISNARLLFGFALLNVLNTIFAYVSALAVMLTISWPLTLMTLAPIPFVTLFLRRFGRQLHTRFLGAQETLGDLSGFLQESLQGYEVVKGFAQEDGFLARFRTFNGANYDANMDLARTRSLLMPLMVFVGGFGVFIILGVGGYFVIEGLITIGEFVAFQGYLGMLVWPTLALGWLFNVLERGLASLVRVDTVLSTEPRIADGPDAAPHTLTGQVRVEPMDVVLRDPGAERSFALRDLELRLEPGQRVAVVGKTGAGKSLLFHLLLRLTELPEGMIFYDDVEIHRIRLAALRGQVGYLTQEPFLMGRTIREALTFGVDGVPAGDDQPLYEALQRAQLDLAKAGLGRGLDTVLGERGVTLSGGQRQRLAIARLLLTDPKLLLFDAPLSAMDFDTAERVRAELAKFAAGRSLIWATHRLSEMTWFDEILLLQEGRITARGDHEAMLKQPLYRTLFERQQLARSLEEMP